MAIIKMYRAHPESIGGPTTADIHDSQVEILQARGWIIDNSSPNTPSPAITLESLLVRALELELGVPAALEAMSAEDLTALIAENTDESAGDDKAALIEKALALKESNPKAVKASPSAIPTMSVNKLTALIAEAEKIIADVE